MNIVLNSITKKYDKNKFGLTEFSLTLNNGILGLLGPNGAGKSTLMKIIATISNPTSGSILLDGIDIVKHPNAMRQILGYLPQDFGVYPNLTGYEFLEYIAALKGVGGPNLRNKLLQLLEEVNLSGVSNKPIGTYSGGMKQRIGIAQVLLNTPKILIFDEPTVGLDPEERVRFRNLISELANDCIIILSSHIVSDIETIADEVAVMKDGKLITHGFQSDIIESVSNKVFEIEIEKDALNAFKESYTVVNTIRKKNSVLVRFISNEQIYGAVACPCSLEDAYLLLSK